MYASINGHKDVVEFLINKGADIKAKSNEGTTALICAARYGYKDIVEILINKGADIEVKNSDGWTALTLAAREGHKDIVEILINKGADIEAKDDDGWTALMYAANNGHKDIVKFLIDNGADVFYAINEAQKDNEEKALEILKQYIPMRNIDLDFNSSDPKSTPTVQPTISQPVRLTKSTPQARKRNIITPKRNIDL
jgi:ankyrin repeat protein